VQLADPRLGDAEDLADLGQRQALVVVEGDDDLLPFAEPVDRATSASVGLRCSLMPRSRSYFSIASIKPTMP
jgi:hypothetical protein